MYSPMLHLIASRRRLRTPQSGSPERKQSPARVRCFLSIAILLRGARFRYEQASIALLNNRARRATTLIDYSKLMGFTSTRQPINHLSSRSS
jgi:hypothetical protein